LDPHDQYLAHDGIGPYGKSLRDRYDAEVTFTDRSVGKLLDFVAAQPWGARTAIVVTSDHGEAFGEHKMYFHGFELFENLVRVPLFFVIPGVEPRRIDEPRSALDIAPTMLALFGLEPHDGYRGVSLLPEFYGATPEARDVPLDLPATSDSDRRRGLVVGTKKVVAGHDDSRLVMYDLSADPEEKTPITKGDAHTEMADRYRAFVKTVKDIPPYACKDTSCLNGGYLKKDAGD
jgi:choline-sulfatase